MKILKHFKYMNHKWRCNVNVCFFLQFFLQNTFSQYAYSYSSYLYNLLVPIDILPVFQGATASLVVATVSTVKRISICRFFQLRNCPSISRYRSTTTVTIRLDLHFKSHANNHPITTVTFRVIKIRCTIPGASR